MAVAVVDDPVAGAAERAGQVDGQGRGPAAGTREGHGERNQQGDGDAHGEEESAARGEAAQGSAGAVLRSGRGAGGVRARGPFAGRRGFRRGGGAGAGRGVGRDRGHAHHLRASRTGAAGRAGQVMPPPPSVRGRDPGHDGEQPRVVHHSQAAAVVDHAGRTAPEGDGPDGLDHGGGGVQREPLFGLTGSGGAHRGADGEHLFAGDVADEVPDVVVGGRADDLLGRAELHDAAVAHQRDPVAQAQGLGEVVRDEDHGAALFVVEPGDLLLHLAPDERVECAERLVEQQHFGVGGECAGQADALLLAARELVGEPVLQSVEADLGDEFEGLCRMVAASGRPGSPVRTPRCRGRCGAGAGRSAGRPWRRGVGAGRAAGWRPWPERPRRRWTGFRRWAR